MNGKLTVQSDLGTGSRFRFVISLPSIKAEDDKRSITEQRNLSPFKVLVTDDNKMNLIIAKGFLDKLDVECVTCNSGFEALTHLETGRFNLVIIDNHMPKMNGLDTVRKIRQAGHNDLVIFGWTADIMQTSTQAFIEAGANEVLTKPLIKSDLVDALSRYLNQIKKVDRAS